MNDLIKLFEETIREAAGKKFTVTTKKDWYEKTIAAMKAGKVVAFDDCENGHDSYASEHYLQGRKIRFIDTEGEDELLTMKEYKQMIADAAFDDGEEEMTFELRDEPELEDILNEDEDEDDKFEMHPSLRGKRFSDLDLMNELMQNSDKSRDDTIKLIKSFMDRGFYVDELKANSEFMSAFNDLESGFGQEEAVCNECGKNVADEDGKYYHHYGIFRGPRDFICIDCAHELDLPCHYYHDRIEYCD